MRFIADDIKIFKSEKGNPYHDQSGRFTSEAEDAGIGSYVSETFPHLELSVEGDRGGRADEGDVITDAIKATGLPTNFDGKVNVAFEKEGDRFNVQITEGDAFNKSDLQMSRTFDQKNGIIINEHFSIGDKYKGQGANMFNEQVDQAYIQGYKKIVTQANKNDEGGEPENGYYTWLRLGYKITGATYYTIDPGPINEEAQKVVKDFNKKYKTNVKDVYELIGIKKGQEYWKKSGFSFHGEFDLNLGSYSMKTLKQYMNDRKKKKTFFKSDNEVQDELDEYRSTGIAYYNPDDENICDGTFGEGKKSEKGNPYHDSNGRFTSEDEDFDSINNNITDALDSNGTTVTSITVSPNLSNAEYGHRVDKVIGLIDEYAINEENVNLTFDSSIRARGSDKETSGYVYRQNGVAYVNFGDSTANSSEPKYGYQLPGKSRFDKENAPFRTQTHEFAHLAAGNSISAKSGFENENRTKFWSEIRPVHESYMNETNSILRSQDGRQKVKDIYLGKYASTNADEFVAEAFAEYKLSSNPSKYAVEVGNIFDKYFGKKKKSIKGNPYHDQSGRFTTEEGDSYSDFGKLRKESHKYYDSRPADEIKALKSWLDSGYKAINKAARAGEENKNIKLIDSYLKSAPKYDGETYRGLDFSKKDFNAFMKKMKVGNIYSDKGYFATSHDEITADDFSTEDEGYDAYRYSVYLQVKGSGGAYVSVKKDEEGFDEYEILYRRNTKFKIKRIQDTDHGMYIDLVEIKSKKKSDARVINNDHKNHNDMKNELQPKTHDELLVIGRKKISTHYKVKESSGTTTQNVDMTKRIVSAVTNTYLFFDSDQDVLMPGSMSKTIQERGPKSKGAAKIKNVKDHVISNRIGNIMVLDERKINGNEVEYGESKMLNTTLGNDTLIEYQEGVIDQHSIGFKYNDIQLVTADDKDWPRILKMLINPKDAEKAGYMFVVKDLTQFEYSPVSFGANMLTPYLGVKSMENKEALQLKVFERLDLLYKQLRSGRQSDETMQEYELEILQLKQIISELFTEEPSIKATLLAERRQNKTDTNQPNEENSDEEEEEKTKHMVTCPGCQKDFDWLSISENGMGYVKCPSCEQPVTQKGEKWYDLMKVIKETKFV